MYRYQFFQTAGVIVGHQAHDDHFLLHVIGKGLDPYQDVGFHLSGLQHGGKDLIISSRGDGIFDVQRNLPVVVDGDAQHPYRDVEILVFSYPASQGEGILYSVERNRAVFHPESLDLAFIAGQAGDQRCNCQK